MNPFRLQIISQTHVLFDQDVVSITVPGADGYFGVLAHHAPMLAVVGKGKLAIRKSELEEEVYPIEGGFFEVRDNEAVLLPDQASGFEETGAAA